MTFSLFSFITAIFWFSIFVCLSTLLKRKQNVFLVYRPLLFLAILSFIRLLIPIEPSFAIELRSHAIVPLLLNMLHERFVVAAFLSSFFTLFTCIAWIVAIYYLLRLAKEIWRNYRLVCHVRVCDDAVILDLLHEIMESTDSTRPCKVVLSKQVQVPAVIGFFRPVIILPEFISAFSRQDIYYFLRHEWQHFLDKDLWTKLLIEVLCCIMWWNPIVYMLRRNMEQTIELKCDIHVTEHMDDHEKDAYLTAIRNALSFCLNHAKPDEPLTARFVGGYSGSATQQKESVFNIKQRFLTVKHYRRGSSPLAKVFFVCATLLFLCSFCFVVQPYSATSTSFNQPIFKIVTPQNSYLIDNGDNSYSLVVDDERIVSVSEGMIQNPPHYMLEIREK